MFLVDGRTIGYYILSFAQIISFCSHLSGSNTNKQKISSWPGDLNSALVLTEGLCPLIYTYCAQERNTGVHRMEKDLA